MGYIFGDGWYVQYLAGVDRVLYNGLADFTFPSPLIRELGGFEFFLWWLTFLDCHLLHLLGLGYMGQKELGN